MTPLLPQPRWPTIGRIEFFSNRRDARPLGGSRGLHRIDRSMARTDRQLLIILGHKQHQQGSSGLDNLDCLSSQAVEALVTDELYISAGLLRFP